MIRLWIRVWIPQPLTYKPSALILVCYTRFTQSKQFSMDKIITWTLAYFADLFVKHSKVTKTHIPKRYSRYSRKTLWTVLPSLVSSRDHWTRFMSVSKVILARHLLTRGLHVKLYVTHLESQTGACFFNTMIYINVVYKAPKETSAVKSTKYTIIHAVIAVSSTPANI